MIPQSHASPECLTRTGRKIFAHDTLADDRYFRRSRSVLRGELASCQHQNSHCLEIARIDRGPPGVERWFGLALDAKLVADEHPAEWNGVDQTRGLQTWQVLDAIEHVARERVDAIGLVEALG